MKRKSILLVLDVISLSTDIKAKVDLDLTTFSKWMERALSYQGISHAFRGNYQDTIGYFSACLKINQQEGSQHRTVDFLNKIGVLDKDIRGIKKIQRKENSIPVIAITASLLKSEISNCYNAGMNNYIPKPYQPQELIRPIYEVIYKEQNQLN